MGSDFTACSAGWLCVLRVWRLDLATTTHHAPTPNREKHGDYYFGNRHSWLPRGPPLLQPTNQPTNQPHTPRIHIDTTGRSTAITLALVWPATPRPTPTSSWTMRSR
jgi:hypothetical protein